MDNFIQQLYGIAGDDDWRTARERGLQMLAQHLGARTAAWLTRGQGGKAGPYTEVPRSGFTRSQLAALRFDKGVPLSMQGAALTLAFECKHSGTNLVSVLCFRWPEQPGENLNDRSAERSEVLSRLVSFLAEASTLAMRLYVQRDEWLTSMGRASRGAAALVDSQGWVYAATDRFVAMIESLGHSADQARRQLPFALPVDVADEGGAFVKSGLHLRVLRMDGLCLLHARRPLPLDVLSPREQQIARALGTGKTFKSVASHCGIAVSTVANHATRIYRKLGIFRREELMEMMRLPGATPAVARQPRKPRPR